MGTSFRISKRINKLAWIQVKAYSSIMISSQCKTQSKIKDECNVNTAGNYTVYILFLIFPKYFPGYNPFVYSVNLLSNRFRFNLSLFPFSKISADECTYGAEGGLSFWRLTEQAVTPGSIVSGTALTLQLWLTNLIIFVTCTNSSHVYTWRKRK